jgi:2-haloacid dehalogenase
MTTKPSKEQADQIDKINPKYQWNSEMPSVLVFDVNETLINFESMNALFERLYGDKHVMREWLGHLIMYSMTLTLSGLYVGYYSLGQGLLQMIGSIKGVKVRPADIEEIRTAMMTMPVHPDVVEGLKHLKKLGYRMVTLDQLAAESRRQESTRAGRPCRIF